MVLLLTFFFFFLKYNLLWLEREIPQGLVKKKYRSFFCVLRHQFKEFNCSWVNNATAITTSERIDPAGVSLRVRENICMKLTSVGKNEARIHDCLGRGSSGTFLMTPLRVRSQVRPLGLHAHVLPAILAVEGSPEPRLSGDDQRGWGPVRNIK